MKIGALNPNFGVGGVVLQSTPLITTDAVAVQSDGKSVAVGETAGDGARDFGVTRFNSDGSLDTTFGQGISDTPGTVTTDFSGGNDVPIAVSIQADGKIVVAGTTYNASNPAQSSFALARYNADGSLDTTFGSGGMVVTSFASSGGTSSDVAESMVLSPSGEIAVCGRSNASGTSDFAVAVYNSDGSLNTAFGGTGKVLTDFLGGDDSANAIGFDPRNGDIVTVGSATNPATGQTEFAAARYLPGGTLDPKFGKAGKAVTSINGSDDEAHGLAISTKGLIVATGASVASGAAELATVRYTASGALDRGFGAGGIVTTNLGQPAVANQVQIDAAGGVLIAGGTSTALSSIDPSHIDVAIVQYTSKGRLDPIFNGGQPLVLNLGATPALARPFRPFDSQTQQALSALAQQRAIAQSLGNLVVVANVDSQTAIAEVVATGADLVSTLQTALAPVVPDAAKSSVKVTVKNAGNLAALGAVTITLYASTTPSLDTSAIQLAASNAGLKLKSAGSKVYKLKLILPPTLPDGTYYVLAKIDASAAVKNVNAADDVVIATAPIQVENPFAGLTGPAPATPTGLTAGSKYTLPLTLQNTSSLPAKGIVSYQVLAAAGAAPASGDLTLASSKLKVSLPPGGSHTFPIKLVMPAAGTYHLLVVLTPPPNQNGSASPVILGGPMPLIVS